MKSIEYISQVVGSRGIGMGNWALALLRDGELGSSVAPGWGTCAEPKDCVYPIGFAEGIGINSVEVSPSETNFLPKVESVLWLLLPEKLCLARWITILFYGRAAG